MMLSPSYLATRQRTASLDPDWKIQPDIAAFTTRIIRLRDGRIVEDHQNTPISAEEQLANNL